MTTSRPCPSWCEYVEEPEDWDTFHRNGGHMSGDRRLVANPLDGGVVATLVIEAPMPGRSFDGSTEIKIGEVGHDWCASFTPAQAREAAACLLALADEAEEAGGS